MHLQAAARDLHTHDHVYVDEEQSLGERRTRMVVALTAVMMIAEIVAGTAFGSMALLADGFHMASHVAALGLAAAAYAYARRNARSRRYTFGTGKIGALAGYTSAVVLGLIALLMAWESVQRLAAPVPIDFSAAMLVAVLGLGVNLASALLLGGHRHDHGHSHSHDRESEHAGGAHDHGDGHDHHHDHNLRAAYVHVLADALTSVLAIVALAGGRYLGWSWLDPAMGLVGAAVILWWSAGLIRGSTRVLLDEEASAATADAIRQRIERDADNRVTDLHLWRVGPHHLAAIISVMTHAPRHPGHYKSLLGGVDDLAHVTIEVVPCPGEDCRAA
jgi:cation diffusion facilitator family transporter